MSRVRSAQATRHVELKPNPQWVMGPRGPTEDREATQAASKDVQDDAQASVSVARTRSPEVLSKVGTEDVHLLKYVSMDHSAEDVNIDITEELYLMTLNILKDIREPIHFPKAHQKEARVFTDSISSLYIWGESFRNGRLGRALNQSKELRNVVVESLCAVAKLALTICNLYCGFLGDVPAKASRLQDLIKRASTVIQDSDISNFDESLEAIANEDSDQFAVLKDEVEILMDLMPAIEDNLSHAEINHQKTPAHSSELSVSDPAKPWVRMIADKFPKASLQLVERLGEANWQRYLSVSAKITNALNRKPVSLDTNASEKGSLPSGPTSLGRDSGLGSSLPAESVASHSSFATGFTESESSSLRVPRVPKEAADGKPFLCKICGKMVSAVRRRVDWKMHVYHDLRSYVCILDHCSNPLTRYASRSEWEQHQDSDHDLVHDRLNVRTEDNSCPLCLKSFGSSPGRKLFIHIGRHLEAISLAALPYDTTQDAEVDSEVESSSEASSLVEHSDHEIEGEIIRCICGHDTYPGPPGKDFARPKDTTSATQHADGDFYIQCDYCSVWQHAGCVSILSAENAPEYYFCEQCKPELHETGNRKFEGRQFSRYLPATLEAQPPELALGSSSVRYDVTSEDDRSRYVYDTHDTSYDQPFSRGSRSDSDNNKQAQRLGSDSKTAQGSWSDKSHMEKEPQDLRKGKLILSESLPGEVEKDYEELQLPQPQSSPKPEGTIERGPVTVSQSPLAPTTNDRSSVPPAPVSFQVPQTTTLPPDIFSAEFDPFSGFSTSPTDGTPRSGSSLRDQALEGSMKYEHAKGESSQSVLDDAAGREATNLGVPITPPSAYRDFLKTLSPKLSAPIQPESQMNPKMAGPRRKRRATPEEATLERQVCGKLFKRSHNYKSHLETHNPNGRYSHQCTHTIGDMQCTKKFQRKTDLDRHVDSVHLKARNHKCEMCGNRFARRDTLRRHCEDGCPSRFKLKMDEEVKDVPIPQLAAQARWDPSLQNLMGAVSTGHATTTQMTDFQKHLDEVKVGTA